MTRRENGNVVKVAVVQAGAVLFDTGACVDKAARLIDEASQQGANVMVFPEALIPGYSKGRAFGLVVGARDPAGPHFGAETILTADHDLDEIGRSRFDFDVTGHCARRDVFRPTVGEQEMKPVNHKP